MDGLMQIGEVARRTGLSLRTIRYYEEVGLAVPVQRSGGGFRLYSEANIAQLELIKHMKPLDFSLEQMRDLLAVVAHLVGSTGSATPVGFEDSETGAQEMIQRLRAFRATVDAKVDELRQQLARAEDFAAQLRAMELAGTSLDG